MRNVAQPLKRSENHRGRGSSSLDWTDAVVYSLLCGAGAGIAANLALALAGKADANSIWQPINATSHWLWGRDAARQLRADVSRTAVGALTNQTAAMFWGAIFGTYLAVRPPQQPAKVLLDAGVMSVIAGAVDYGLVPRRLTPGWELALPPRSVAATLAAMALGLAAGGILAQRGRTANP